MTVLDLNPDVVRFGYKSYNEMISDEAIKPVIYGFVLPLLALLLLKSLATAMLIPVIAASIQAGIQGNHRKAMKTAQIGMVIPGIIVAILLVGMASAAL